ncbi:MAG: NAD(P)/FAD-dependent oxidoreductase [Rhodococcus sp. (in: high G+C Gram-positive bacteria)]
MSADTPTLSDPVTIVGAGIAGAACARVLHDANIPFRIVDRGRAPGGRMSSPELHGRRVDLGAGYFTVRDQDFTTVVADWESRGLARQWANTFGILKPETVPCTTTGPVRWATPGGLRSLVRDLLDGIDVEGGNELTELPGGHVVVAMPDPQAIRITSVHDAVDYVPVIAVACGFEGLDIPFRDAAFVNDHPDIDFVVDDGARRGDDAPVLVVHTTSDRAQQHLADPDGAIAPAVAALRELSVIRGNPTWTHAHRWTFAKPAAQHDSSFALDERDGRFVGLAGDQWCESGVPRVESAWRSGTDMGTELVRRLQR